MTELAARPLNNTELNTDSHTGQKATYCDYLQSVTWLRQAKLSRTHAGRAHSAAMLVEPIMPQ